MKRPRTNASPEPEPAGTKRGCGGECAAAAQCHGTELLLATPSLPGCLRALHPSDSAASLASLAPLALSAPASPTSSCGGASSCGAMEEPGEEPCTPRGAIMSGPPPLPPAPSKARRAALLPPAPLHAVPAPAPAWSLPVPPATRRRLYGAPAATEAAAEAAAPPRQLTNQLVGAWFVADLQEEVSCGC